VVRSTNKILLNEVIKYICIYEIFHQLIINRDNVKNDFQTKINRDNVKNDFQTKIYYLPFHHLLLVFGLV
jgi:hypothetical protein